MFGCFVDTFRDSLPILKDGNQRIRHGLRRKTVNIERNDDEERDKRGRVVPHSARHQTKRLIAFRRFRARAQRAAARCHVRRCLWVRGWSSTSTWHTAMASMRHFCQKAMAPATVQQSGCVPRVTRFRRRGPLGVRTLLHNRKRLPSLTTWARIAGGDGSPRKIPFVLLGMVAAPDGELRRILTLSRPAIGSVSSVFSLPCRPPVSRPRRPVRRPASIVSSPCHRSVPPAWPSSRRP